MVVEFLLDENYANNPVSAEALFNHMSDEFLLEIEERIEEGMAPPAAMGKPAPAKAVMKAAASGGKPPAA